MRILIAGGGTAGHVFPAVALAQRFSDVGVEVLFVGTSRGLETDLVPKAGFRLEVLEVRPFPRRISPDLYRAPVSLIRAARRCRPLVMGCDVVVGMGGYASAPAVLAARRVRIPIVLHEQNAIPGAANKWLARWARVVGLSFAEARERFPKRVRTITTGNPVRMQVAMVPQNREPLRTEAMRELDLDPMRRTIVVFGGSQGALHVNIVAAQMCHVLADRADLQVLLLTGPAHETAVAPLVPFEPALRVRIMPFLDRMELAYAAADLIVSRAGATSIAESTACGLPAVLIPYPHATANHQEANARALESTGGAIVILDADLSADLLAAHVRRLMDEEGRLATLAQRSASFGRPVAAAALADLVLKEAGR